jgi:hypothetical protein
VPSASCAILLASLVRSGSGMLLDELTGDLFEKPVKGVVHASTSPSSKSEPP